ncbi:MAG: MBL fold metallo-hydrolase [Deltaproteobacteria bacterium]|nr:MBL fold metallo-hydrolase [Deltaproteobacteria bacterium]
MSEFWIRSLASGSRGNCWILAAGSTRVLVDAGINAKQIQSKLLEAGVEPESIQAIFLTHEHSDHIGGIPVLSRRFGMPTFTAPETAGVPKWGGKALAHERGVRVVPLAPGEPACIGEITVRSFPVSHDAADPMMFVFEHQERRIGFATDLGMVTRLVHDRLRGVDALVLESNHDVRMLDEGPYRPEDKKRIKSRLGHLSNEQAQEFVRQIAHPGLGALVLAHLSKINNTPEIAHAGMRAVLDEVAPHTHLSIALQDEIGEVIAVPHVSGAGRDAATGVGRAPLEAVV